MKRIASVFLALAVVFSLSVPVFAAGDRGSCQVCGVTQIDCPSCLHTATYCVNCDLCSYCNYSSASGVSGNETVITYTGEGSEQYTITVPSTLEPGQSGTVKAEGTWASNRMLKVTAADTVTVTNSIDGGEKILDVNFAGIEQSGSNETSITVSKSISIGNISNALFGTWTGVITYNVSMESNG